MYLSSCCEVINKNINKMNRKKLISAVQQICSNYGYSFRVVDAQSLSAQSPALPAAVLETPEFQKMEGRSRGRITYKVVLHLFEKGAKLSPEKQAEQLSQMESDMLGIFMQLSENEDVALVEDLQIDSAAHLKLGRAELSMTATAEVVIIF